MIDRQQPLDVYNILNGNCGDRTAQTMTVDSGVQRTTSDLVPRRHHNGSISYDWRVYPQDMMVIFGADTCRPGEQTYRLVSLLSTMQLTKK